MKIPLGLSKIGNQLIYIGENRNEKILKLPMEPYIFVKSPVPSGIHCYDLSGKKQVLKKQIDNSKRRKLVDDSYIYELAIIEHPIIPSLKFNSKPNILYFDIEAGSKGDGRFPTPRNNLIVAIAYAINDGPVQVLETIKNDSVDSDEVIIKEFLKVLYNNDIHIICGYYSSKFDMPYIMNRAKENKIDPIYFSKPAFRPLIKHDKIIQNAYKIQQTQSKTTFLGLGFLHYDIFYTSVITDTSLSGIKNKKLKTVSKYFGFDPIMLEDSEIGNIMGMIKDGKKSLLLDYVESDVLATQYLGEKYFVTEVALAEMIGLPLDVSMRRRKGTLPTIAIDREFRRANRIETAYNCVRYPDIYSEESRLANKNKYMDYEHPEFYDDSKKPYEGALVDIFHFGKFSNVYKVDFSSFYPSTMITFGISPDTTKVVRKEDGSIDYRKYTGKYSYWWDKNTFNIIIPDSKLGANIPVQIDFNKDGVIKNILINALEQRKVYKQLKKNAKNKDDEKTFDAYSLAFKVLANSMYGIIGNKNSSVGDVICALTITGICRHLTQIVLDYIGMDYVIELDTDGLYISKDIDINEINQLVEDYIISEMGMKKNYIYMEKDVYGRGYFHLKKNYVIEKPGTNMDYIVKGSTLVNTKHSEVIDRATEIFIDSVLFGKYSYEEAYKIAHDIQNYPPESFVMTVKAKRKSSYYGQLANQVIYMINSLIDHLGKDIDADEQIEYIFAINTPAGVEIVQRASKDIINYEQYHIEIDKIAQIFSKEYNKDRSLI